MAYHLIGRVGTAHLNRLGLSDGPGTSYRILKRILRNSALGADGWWKGC